ncbi:putative glycosyl transferase [Shigella flexneri 2a]|uniref:glycosyltransferase n=1 Tax=Shigella flexneri TaxID=623 RepID=UPI000DA4D8F7|nr:glycosyltransferase [Shigella flexneri]ELQ3661542.1 colanic acid biosynthesis glycosyltransferase WcaC [Escherichia coli]EFZ2124408.1 colanic acid biosynthesis glycosyltransferase WcaC [Shigella flexneri]EFZ3485326.1 colanic acid biosynthesis glycosyltransferase WcaC [Shigella flexneri]SRI19826.1 putative glycosyl transferase [Shigella flexneri 2a]SRP09301.1 putative glycosyl transferase [Shigella flexneri]
MNILQFNVRLAEGGAAGVALDLHQRALQQGLASHFVYGYGKGGKESVSHQNYPQVIKHTPRMTAMANIALFRLFNRDLFGNFNELYRTITRTPGPVVLHFHVLHSYWLNLNSVVRFCEKVKNHKPDVTLVWTLHDHWSVTGRCAFTDGCEGWKTGCQKCPTLNNYPPVKIDRAHQLVAGKRQLFREMLALGDKIELHTFGKFSPFTAGNVVNHGFETDKRKLMSALNQMDALVFSSRVDNYPLILCEALSIGVPVIATHSDAAREVLQKSGGKTVSEEEVLQLVQLSKPEIAQAIFGTTLAEFSQRSRAAYSGQQMLEEYVNFYQNL